MLVHRDCCLSRIGPHQTTTFKALHVIILLGMMPTNRVIEFQTREWAILSQAYSLEQVKAVNETAAFNRWAHIEIVKASSGEAEIRAAWRDDFGQYAGFMHAGLISALLDTACGFAASTVSGNVLATHISVSCLAPAVGTTFTALGHVVRAGKRQIFTKGELFASSETAKAKLVATADVLLLPNSAS